MGQQKGTNTRRWMILGPQFSSLMSCATCLLCSLCNCIRARTRVVDCRRHAMQFYKIHPRELQLERGRRLVHLRPVLKLQGISTRPPPVVRPDARRRRRQRICCARWGDFFRAQGSCLPHGTCPESEHRRRTEQKMGVDGRWLWWKRARSGSNGLLAC